MKIHDNEGNLLAIIVKKNEQTAGKNVYTDNSSEWQLATFELSEDETIDRHIHDEQIRNIVRTSEAIILQEGVLVFDIYDICDKFGEISMMVKCVTCPLHHVRLHAICNICDKFE